MNPPCHGTLAGVPAPVCAAARRRAVGLFTAFAALLAGALPACEGWAQAAPAAAPAAASPASPYLGWRLFQANCARCHGADATGSANAPDLLPRVKGMSEARFVAAVLQRYHWVLPAGEAAREGAAREALIQDVLRRRRGEVEMPAWESEPTVKAHIDDLNVYLDARANGTLGPGRPVPPSR